MVLVLADSLLLMYLGWERRGLYFLPADRLLLHRSEQRGGNESVRVDSRWGRVPGLRLFILYNELGTLNFPRNGRAGAAALRCR